MGQVKPKFGWSQRFNPTPKRAEVLIDFSCDVLSAISGFLVAVTFVPASFSNVASPIISILLVPILRRAKMLFGVEINKKTVPTEQVEVIDQSAKKDN